METFPGSSAGKESTCNAGDPGLIPGSGRTPGEGIGYLFQYSWASLVAQMVKNLPTMWETWIQSLGWEDPLEEGMATPAFLPGESPWREEPRGLQSMGSQRVRHDWATRQTTQKGKLRLHKTMEAGEGKKRARDLRVVSSLTTDLPLTWPHIYLIYRFCNPEGILAIALSQMSKVRFPLVGKGQSLAS